MAAQFALVASASRLIAAHATRAHAILVLVTRFSWRLCAFASLLVETYFLAQAYFPEAQPLLQQYLLLAEA